MRTDEVTFYSGGSRIAALWRTPDSPAPTRSSRRMRAIVQGPGWLGLRDSRLYVRYSEALTAA
ncbi:MAG: alpha/beta hydrolase, partial [Ktedonobacterales bacterium]